MKRVNEVTEELESMGSILAGMSHTMPFSLPAGYFEQNSVDLAGRIFVGQPVAAGDLRDTISTLELHSRAMPHAVPEGYFQQLASSALAAAIADPVFTAPKTLPYGVPAGYFDSLPQQVLNTVRQPLQSGVASKPITTKRIPLPPAFTQVRWAVAAVLLVCITLGGYISFFSGGQTGTESELASVTKEELQDYLQHSYVMDVNRIVYTNDINQLEVDTKDIEQYLNETGWDIVD